MITYKRATSDQELQEILAIQKRNLKAVISLQEREEQGYITIPHTFEILKKMNDACPHILAMDGDRVAGYALVMLRSFKYEMPILIPMFETADRLLKGKNYVAMGQVCIDKPYRGQDVFKGMYTFYKVALSDSFDCLFTEVATSNIRSLEAHKRVGFKILETQITDGTSWEIVNWDWNE
ncbi:GNAT family N-acetyltransferase [uncultured Dokdonia sp.]|uniref:GNAT family N-acetyltransferase n=1 Tax=uncultured Dokdonia sp. TaxID=575653 RepID=UPI00261C3D7B|nr:GNAT family N-acetyltransferase [uncultured Dokdonia sp.]